MTLRSDLLLLEHIFPQFRPYPYWLACFVTAGLSEAIHLLAVSADGKFVATADHAHDVHIYSLEKKKVRTLIEHGNLNIEHGSILWTWIRQLI